MFEDYPHTDLLHIAGILLQREIAYDTAFTLTSPRFSWKFIGSDESKLDNTHCDRGDRFEEDLPLLLDDHSSNNQDRRTRSIV